ncbi:MAG: extracellular solute-binding protein [Treponema sp.]|jgi:multiple sugar transport system substrate-binding protein|nr:extracellular solute-binding protein [Treponema sp.]
MKNTLRFIPALCLALCLVTLPVFGGGKSEVKPAAPGTVTLTFYGFSDWVATEPWAKAYGDAKAQFEAENPGYRIEIQSDPWGDWEQKNRTMFASGNPADVFFVNNPDVPAFANSGNLLDLSPYTGAAYFEQFFPGVTAMYLWNGKHVAIPFTTDCRIFWYNKDIFTQAGLDPDKPPTTWAELVSYANTITQKTGKYGFGLDLGLKEFPMQAAFNASNGSVITVDAEGNITPNVDTPEFRAYLQMLLDLKPTFEPDYANLNHHDVARLFVEGQLGMIIGNTLVETNVYEKNFHGQSLVPRMNASAPNGSYGGGFGIAVSSRTRAPEQAVKFAQLLCSARYNAPAISDLPASSDGLAVSEFAANPRNKVYMEQIRYARQFQPKTLYFMEIQAACYDTVVEVVMGGESIDNAIRKLTGQINRIISEK